MKPSFHITATVDQPDLLKNLVEKLAYRRSDGDFYRSGKENQTSNISSTETFVNTSSTEAYISGNIGLEFFNGLENEQVHIPFITCFVFTCKRSESDPYELAWSQSLS